MRRLVPLLLVLPCLLLSGCGSGDDESSGGTDTTTTTSAAVTECQDVEAPEETPPVDLADLWCGRLTAGPECWSHVPHSAMYGGTFESAP